MQKITPHLWFDKQAEEAAKYYTSVFKDGKILMTSYYGEAGKEIHKMPAGTAMTVVFELAGQKFMALNGGPLFKFNESISFMVNCDDQAEIDYFWEKLSAGGDESAQQCGWLKDKFGLSWQIIPSNMGELMGGPNSQAVMTAFMQMKKIDANKLNQVAKG
jgi:predicted 3-demethylubiquinone-9 3-methyltransferase (glyoxalase superfamily)